ncbi:MAG TPA: hypothetical protein VGL93_18795 [Streptosporangiaceae bacterium]
MEARQSELMAEAAAERRSATRNHGAGRARRKAAGEHRGGSTQRRARTA